MQRPDPKSLIGKDTGIVPKSLQRIVASTEKVDPIWIGPEDGKKLSKEDQTAYDLAHRIMCHLAVQAPTKHASGHPGGALSSFTFAYLLSKRRNPAIDQPLRYSAGHLSVLAYGLQWLFGREGNDQRLQSPQTIIDTFRIPNGLPGHVEAGIGDIPFGTGPLGKGTSHALGAAFGLKYQKKPGVADVLLADGDSQEGQVMEAFRLASRLKLDNLVVHGDFNDVQLSDLPSKTVAADFAAIAQAAGWQVIEVQNGNDPAQVHAALEKADVLIGKGHPIFLCYYTTMGYGVPLMEEGSNTGTVNYHGTPLKKEDAEKIVVALPPLEELMSSYEPFRKEEKERCTPSRVKTDLPLPWTAKGHRAISEKDGAARKDFGATHIRDFMKHDERIVVLHADLEASGGFDSVEKEFPHRVINVGVAEANMYMMAAGMRQVGLLPVTYTFAAFGTNEARASARLIDINCSHTRCGVIHDCTHSGVSVGEDGETHQEQNYLALPFRHTQVWMPADGNQSGAMAERAFELIAEGHTSVYVFSPRTGQPQVKKDGTILYGKNYRFDGKADLVRGMGNDSDQVTILACGQSVHDAMEAADRLAAQEKPIRARVLNVACIRPIDAATVIASALETFHLITVEDHNTEGGLGSQVADIIADFQLPCSLRRLGLNHFFPSGTAEDLKFLAGLDADSIMNAVEDELGVEVHGGEDALVTCIHTMFAHLSVSRFREQAQTFLDRLISEKRYLDRLRERWKERAAYSDRLPTNEQLMITLQNTREGYEE